VLEFVLEFGYSLLAFVVGGCSAFVAVEEENRRRSPELENVMRVSPAGLGVCR
jgi:hypothetical protein